MCYEWTLFILILSELTKAKENFLKIFKHEQRKMIQTNIAHSIAY